MAEVRFTQDGRQWAFDVEKLTTLQAIELKKLTGMTVGEWGQGLDAGDAESYRALVWLSRKAAGDTPEGRYSEFDFPLLEVMASLESDEQPDPTTAGVTSLTRSRRTARSSRTSTG